MEIPRSIIDPATASEGQRYVIAIKDDDWDDWLSLDEAPTYHGWRGESGRWNFRGIGPGGELGDWSYGDDEIVILGEVS